MNFDSSVLQVAIEDIIPNRYQPRQVFDDSSLDDLAQSIKQYGIIQPLVLRKLGDKYEIVAGERRYRAAKKAGLASVPCVVTTLDAQKVAEVAIAENTQRHELTAIEEAKSYQALLDQGFMSKEQLAIKMSIPLESLENKLKLLTLDEQVQNAVLKNQISDKHAKVLLEVSSKTAQVSWLNRIISEKMTVKDLRNELRKEYGITTDINTIKETAMDIPIVNMGAYEMPLQPNDPLTSLGPINLGGKAKETFYNNLEQEAANMSMSEPTNPFMQTPSLDSNPSISTVVTPSEPILPQQSAIENLDSLDFTPQLKPEIKDLTFAKTKINGIVSELINESYNVNLQMNEMPDAISYVITIKK